MKKKILKIVFKTVLWTTGVFLVVLVVFIASLFLREQRIPGFIVRRLEDRTIAGRLVVRVESASFGIRRGLRLRGVRLYDLERENSLENPMATARQILVDYFSGEVTAIGLVYERLPDSYYEETTEAPAPGRVEVELPEELDVRVVLEEPSLLGLRPDRVTARIRKDVDGRLQIEDASVKMPDKDSDISLGASATADFDAQTLKIRAAGDVSYASIAPVLAVLDQKVALPYVAATTEVNEPIPARATADVDLFRKNFGLDIRFSPPRCRYRGVSVVRSNFGIGVRTENVGTNRFYRFTLDVERGDSAEGRQIAGQLSVYNKDGPDRLLFDADSTLKFDELMSVIDVFDREDLSGFVCDTPPHITVKGTCMTDEADAAANDLAGTLELRHGSLLGFRVNDMKSDIALKRDVLSATSEAKGKTGGHVKWESRFYMPEFEPEKFHYWASVDYRDGSLEEVADIMDIDFGERKGTVDAKFEVSGFVNTNAVSSIYAKGSVKITEGYLAQMKLFAGLTELFAERVPGVSFLVNQSQASADFTVTEGVFKSENVYIEGGLVSIKGNGTYDIVADDLDFIVRVQLFKNDSLMGKIIHPLTMPFTKMLLEFRLTGPVNNPKWQYVPISNVLF